MSVLLQDVRFAVRTLIKAPGFVIVATITLALAIGANTAMFSLVNTAIFGPLPFEDGDRLMRVFRQAGEEGEIHFFSYPDYREYRDRSDVFEEFIACSFVPVSVGSGEQNETRFGQIVSGNYFAALGVDAIEGRMLTPADDQTPGRTPWSSSVMPIGSVCMVADQVLSGRPSHSADTPLLLSESLRRVSPGRCRFHRPSFGCR